MNQEIFLQRVMRRTGIDQEELADRTIRATLEVLGERLPAVDVEPIAAQLPEAYVEPFERFSREYERYNVFEVEAFFARVGQRTGVETRFAMEHVQVVCQVLTECLDEEGRGHLHINLPDSWSALFYAREHRIRTDNGRGRQAPGQTLADGRPGSSRPLNEADVAQRDSLAATDDPHAGEMLATSHGKPARRTLAEGRPGSSRPLSDAGEEA